MTEIEQAQDRNTGNLACLRCKDRSRLQRTGREPYRLECPTCGQNYFVVMQLIPVPSDDRPMLGEPSAESSPRSA